MKKVAPTRIAFCRDCKTVIAVGNIPDPKKTALPYHTVLGEKHQNVGVLEIPARPLPSGPKKLGEFFKELSKEFKSKF